MNNNNYRKPEITIDESKMEPAPSVFQKIMHSITAVVLGIVLAQLILWSTFKFSNFLTGNSVIWLFPNHFFQAYLLALAIIGWISGKDFNEWIKDKMDYWNLF